MQQIIPSGRPWVSWWSLLLWSSAVLQLPLVLPCWHCLLGTLPLWIDQEVCQMMGDLVMHLVANRCKRQMWLSSSWLTLQAKLLSPDAGKRAAVVEQMRKQVAALEEAKRQRSSFWQGVVRRSFFAAATTAAAHVRPGAGGLGGDRGCASLCRAEAVYHWAVKGL